MPRFLDRLLLLAQGALALARTHQHPLAIQDYNRALGLKASDEIRQLRCESLKVMGREREC